MKKEYEEAMKSLKNLWNGNEITGKDFTYLNNFILKSQQQEKELEEIKNKIREYFTKPKRDENGDLENSFDYFIRAKNTQNKVIHELKELVEEKDE